MFSTFSAVSIIGGVYTRVWEAIKILVRKHNLPLPWDEKENTSHRRTRTYRGIIKSFVASHYAIHRSLDAIQMIESPCNLTHDIVETRTQPTARDDGRIHGLGVEMQLLPGPGTDECTHNVSFAGLPANIGQNALAIPYQHVVLGARVSVDIALRVLFQREHDIIDPIALRGEIFPELFQLHKVETIGFEFTLTKQPKRWEGQGVINNEGLQYANI